MFICVSIGIHIPQCMSWGQRPTKTVNLHLLPCLRQALLVVCCYVSQSRLPVGLWGFSCLASKSIGGKKVHTVTLPFTQIDFFQEKLCAEIFFLKTDNHAQDKVLDFILSWWLDLVQQAQQWYMHG